MNNFHVGQKVVCVDVNPWRAEDDLGGLTKGSVYTIRRVGFHQHPTHPIGRYLGIVVDEIYRPCQTPYLASRFRPVHTTSIAVFKAMLAPTPHRETV